MKLKSLKHIWIFVSILAITAMACRFGAPAVEPVTTTPSNDAPISTPGELSQSTRSNLIAATVQIIALANQGDDLVPLYVGSGTILTPSGLILTNAHVASPASQGEPELEPDVLGIALIVSEDKPAVPSYVAKVLAVDGYLDLAVLQIDGTVNGSAVNPGSLNLPYVELANSDDVRVGDNINIFGFPSIGGNTITFTKGNVSGFSSESRVGDRAWIKTDATISGGNSGGLAADNNGRIIGVPTIAASGAEGLQDITDCRQIQDTNGDGVVNQNDSCIPIGGFLNGIRPVNLARPLIEAAQTGRQYTSPFTQSGVVSNPGSGNETASDFVWLDTSVSTTQTCDWTNTTISSYDASALCIAAGFEYSGMADGQLVKETWYMNGEQVSEYSYAWEWGESGLFGTYLLNDGSNPMPAGTYRLEMYAGDALTLMGRSGEVTVAGGGNQSQPQPSSNTDTVSVYGLVYDSATNNPISGAYVFLLTSGTTYDEWADSNYNDNYIVAYLETGANGRYEITGIPRNTDFTLVYAAQGYYDAYADDLIATSSDPDSFELNVGLTK
jgi:serine protease Do